MSTESHEDVVRIEVELQFQGAGHDGPPETSVFVYDVNGQFVSSSAVENSAAALSVPARLAGQTVRVFVGPRRQASETPAVADLSWQQAFESRQRLDAGNPKLSLVILEPIWLPWRLCRCVVTGQLVTTLTLPDGSTQQLPICNSRVTISEVTPVWILLARLPDPLVLQLRDAVLDIVSGSAIPVPVAAPAPAAGALALPTSPSAAAAVPARRPPSSVIGAPVPQRTFTVSDADAIGQDTLLALSRSPSVDDIRARLIEIGPIIAPWFCYWEWLEPWLLVNPLETVTTDENGKFFAVIWYPCSGPRPNLYFSAQQLQGSTWVSVYQPGVRCSTHWDFACGSNVTLNVTDPSAIPCAPAPPVTTPTGVATWVMPTAVGGSWIWGTYPTTPAPTGWVQGDGLTAYGSIVNAPFGGFLGLRSGSSIDIPSTGLYYYRWSWRLAGTSDDFTPLFSSVTKYYVKQSPTTLPSFPSYQLGPDTVGAESGLFQFKPLNPPPPGPSDPPGTITYWPTDGSLGDIYSGYWNTPSLGGAAATAGEYQVKLEVFNEAGILVDPGAGTFMFVVPDGFGSDGVTITTRAADGSEVIDGGFVFNVHIDNNPCSASIDPASIGATSVADACGFLGYGDASDPVTLAFHAQHPNNFAVFSWTMVRGLTALGAFDVTEAEVAAASAGPYTGDGVGDFSGTKPAAALLGGCVDAAFGESLYVTAKATTGWGDHITGYDAPAQAAFALKKND